MIIMEKKTVKNIILNCEKLERRIAVMTSGKIEEYQLEHNEEGPAVGDIYLGRISNLDPLLQAAFIDIGEEKKAFLHYHDMLQGGNSGADDEEENVDLNVKSKRKARGKLGKKMAAEAGRRGKKLSIADIPQVFKPGSEIVVQVVKSPISTKGARVTTEISIPGRYLVLMPYSEHIGLSSRIEGAPERERLRKIVSDLELPDGMGLICRTAGEGRKEEHFRNDLEILLTEWRRIEEEAEKRKGPFKLLSEPSLVERTVRDVATDDITGIYIDDKEARDEIVALLKQVGCAKFSRKVHLYKGATTIFEYYGIDKQLREVFQREVKLPGGGAIVIDETEALIAIDVNSGHGNRKNTDAQPEFILQVNLEAAAEIARQLKLRNICGLVVLDFIDMRSAKDRDEVYHTMKKLVKSDRARTKVLPISRLGLMEMTRQREHESLQDQVYNPCPYCKGSGLVKSALTIRAEIQRSLSAVMKNKRYKNVSVRVFMHPEILARLRNEDSELLDELESKYGHALSFRADPLLHCEEFRIVDAVTGQEL